MRRVTLATMCVLASCSGKQQAPTTAAGQELPAPGTEKVSTPPALSSVQNAEALLEAIDSATAAIEATRRSIHGAEGIFPDTAPDSTAAEPMSAPESMTAP